MGQEERGVPEAPALAAGRNEPGIGRFLARERNLRGISLDELAALTKIPRRSLERLESGAFDAQPDGFARGFVRTVAEALGLDPDQTVMRLMHEPAADEAEPRSRRVPGPPPAGLPLVAVAGLLLAALLAWWLIGDRRAEEPEPSDHGVVLRRDAVRDLVRERAAGEDAGASSPEATAASAPEVFGAPAREEAPPR